MLLSALALLLSPASAFVAGPARMVQRPVLPASTSPVMVMGGAGRAFGRIARIVKPVMKIPGKPTGGSGFGCGNDGGDGGDATPAREPAGDDSNGDNPLVSIWKAYNSKLESDPLIMKMLTSFTGFLLGDLIAQTCITKGDFDWFRLNEITVAGYTLPSPSPPPPSPPPPSPLPPPPLCINTNSSCEYWASIGECEVNPMIT